MSNASGQNWVMQEPEDGYAGEASYKPVPDIRPVLFSAEWMLRFPLAS